MKRLTHEATRQTPQQIVRKLPEGERRPNERNDITEVVRRLEIAEHLEPLTVAVRRHQG